MGFITECPACDEEIEISDADIRKAKRKASTVGGKLLKGCPNCCRVLEIDGDDLKRLETAKAEDDDFLCCIPLEGVVAKMPAGGEEHLGIWEYSPGSGEPKLERWPYMATYGIDPACAMKKAGR